MNPLPQGWAVRSLVGGLCLLYLAQEPALAASGQGNPPAFDNAIELASALAVEQARPQAPLLDRSAFLEEPTLRQVLQSPDGLQIAWLQQGAERASVWVMDSEGAPARALLTQSDASRLYWSRDSRWVFAQSPTRLLALSVAGSEASTLIATLKPDSEQQVFGADPGHPAAMLLIESEPPADTAQPSTSRLWRVDRQGQRTLLLENPLPLVDLAFNPQGRLRYIKQFDGDAFAILQLGAAGARRELARCTEMRRCTLISADADDALWIIGNIDTDLASLQRVQPDGSLQTLHRDPRGEADLRELTVHPQSFKPLVAHYGSTSLHSHALGADTERWLQPISREYPDARLQISVGTDPTAPALIGVSHSQSQLTRWFLRSPAENAARPILDELQQASLSVPEETAARKIPVRWLASDGMTLHGFVSVPPGRDAARLPLVVKVHGGPWTLTGPDYSAATQFLANRGYAVFEPNFRGSTGLGRDYLLAAKGDFGHGRVQLDIVEGTRWLLAQGVGDPQRVAILGASFGGYSALLGVTHEPELFRLAIAAVPPSDFAWTLRWAVEHRVLELESTVPFEQTLRALDLNLDDAAAMARLSAGSPLAQAHKLARPVVLFAGGQDQRVAIRSVTHYAARLLELGKDVDLYIEKRAGHEPDGAVPREAWLSLLEQALQRELGGTAPPPPDPAVASYLQRNQRIERGRLRP
ncbi:MAG: prolyl oligopeptidase family serine peptidase [Lysobacterales bacterium]